MSSKISRKATNNYNNYSHGRAYSREMSETSEIRGNHVFDQAALLRYLAQHKDAVPLDAPVAIRQFTNGARGRCLHLIH